MAKILKVKITRSVDGNRIDYVYPNSYDKDKILITCYEHVGDQASIDSRGGGYEYWIGVVSDTDATGFLENPDITELTQQEAETLGDTWRPQVDYVVDVIGVAAIVAKLRASESLTQEEDDSINPDNAAIGINKSIAYSQLLSNTLTAVG